jgi:repressor LexA
MARSKYTDVEKNMIKDISVNLKRLLTLKGMSQTELSVATGLSVSTISDYARGKTLLSPGNLQKIADALNVLKQDINSRLMDTPSISPIPLVLTINEDSAIFAVENVKELIYYPIQNAQQPKFAFIMPDDSMVDAGILSGDIVYVRYSPWAEFNGQIILVLIDSHNSLKRMIWSEGSPYIQLVSDKTIEVLPNKVNVRGVYMGHFRL